MGENCYDFQGKDRVTELSVIWLITVIKFRFAGTEMFSPQVLIKRSRSAFSFVYFFKMQWEVFLSQTNPINLGSLMIPSVEVCMIKLKILKCLHDIWLCYLPCKVLICQVSTAGCQGKAQWFCFPRTCMLVQKMKRRKRKVYLSGKILTAVWFPWLILSRRRMPFRIISIFIFRWQNWR